MCRLIFLLLFPFFSGALSCEGALEKPVLVFDYGGVLSTVDKEGVKAFIQEKLGISREETHLLMQALRKERKKSKDEGVAWKKAARSRGLILPDNWVSDLDERILASVQRRPHMMELVEDLKERGFQVALLSNISKREAEYVRRLGFYEPFHPVLLSCQTGVSKPHPHAFKLLLKCLKVPANQVIFIDDQEQNIQAAQLLGIDGIQFVSYEQLKESLVLRLRPIHKQPEASGFRLSQSHAIRRS